jgi:hypothetical protein
VELPTTNVIALRPTWAVVMASYVRLHAEADSASAITGHLRRGDVASVDRVSLAGFAVPERRVRWVQLSSDGRSGWAAEDDLELFTSETQATNAAANLVGPTENPDG